METRVCAFCGAAINNKKNRFCNNDCRERANIARINNHWAEGRISKHSKPSKYNLFAAYSNQCVPKENDWP